MSIFSRGRTANFRVGRPGWLSGPPPSRVAENGERAAGIQGGVRDGPVPAKVSIPAVPFGGGRDVRPGMGNPLADEKGIIAFQSERALRRNNLRPGEGTRAVFTVIVDDVLRAVERDILPAAVPERRIESGIEPVMNREKRAHFLPQPRHIP